MSSPRLPRPRSVALDVLFAAAAIALAVAFISAFGFRPATILSGAALDDALFIRLGQKLAAGHWLGPYDQRTLVKGPGLPVFLAIVSRLGLPYVLSLALFHTACSALAAWVVRCLTASRLVGFAVFAALLLMPTIYLGDMLRVTRDIFYNALTIGLVASAIALATRRGLPRWTAAVLTGGLGAWWWLTREEGVWLLPTFAILALTPLLAPIPAGSARERWAVRAHQYAPPAAAAAIGLAGVMLFGLVNWAVYGSFVVNEIKDRSFAGAMDALQSVGAPLHRDKVPVPRAARAEIYPVSPTFARVRRPILDGELSNLYLADSCVADKRLCGEFGAGWFMWVFREAAAVDGQHASPGKAKAFYGSIAREVHAACRRGQLKCAGWSVPLAPPIREDQLDDIAISAGHVFKAMTFNDALNTEPQQSDLSAPDGAAMFAFLHERARPTSGPVTRAVRGWFRLSGPAFFTVEPSPLASIIGLERRPSKDLVRHFGDAGLGQNRFLLAVRCQTSEACPIKVRLDDGTTMPLDMAKASPGSTQVGAATLHFEEFMSAGQGAAPAPTLPAFSKAWVGFVTRQNAVFRGLLLGGALAIGGLAVHAAVTRRLSPALIVALALLAGVGARVVLLAVIDVVAFGATGYGYALPAIPLMLIAAIVSLAEAARLVVAGLGRRSGPRAAPAAG